MHKERTKHNMKRSDLLFTSALIMYILYTLLGESVIGYMISSGGYKAIQILVLILLLFKWVYYEKLTKKQLSILLFILGVAVVVALHSDYSSLLVTIVLIISARRVKFNRIVRTILFVSVAFSVSQFFLSQIGIIEDYTFNRFIGGEYTEAHALGFKHYIFLGAFCMSLTMIYVYLRDNITFFEMIILLALNYYLYRLHTTRLAFLISVLFLICVYLSQKIRFSFASKMVRRIVALVPYICFVGTWIILYLYSTKRFMLINEIFSTTNARLSQSAIALGRYGITLFGRNILQIGMTDTLYGSETSSSYIDSGYVFMLLGYGVVFSLIYLFLLSKVFVYLYERKSIVMCLWFGAMLVASVVNNFLFDIVNNPILFCIPASLLCRSRENSITFSKKRHAVPIQTARPFS